MYASEGKRGRAGSIEGIVKRGRTNRQTDSKRGFLHGKSLDTTLVSVVLCIRFLFHGSFYNCRILSASRTLESHSNFNRFYTIVLTNYFSLSWPSIDFWSSRKYWTQYPFAASVSFSVHSVRFLTLYGIESGKYDENNFLAVG